MRRITSVPRNFGSRNKSSTEITSHVDNEELNPKAPVRYSTSRAAQWKVQYKALIKDPDALDNPDEEFRNMMYLITIMGFVLYAFLREGNEWDDEMAMPLGKRMLELREYQANNELKKAIENKDDITDIMLQLKSIEKLRKEYKYT